MGSASLNKKRKLRDAESVPEAVAATKKSKKAKSPAPPADPPTEDEEGGSDESIVGRGTGSEESEDEEHDGDGESEGGASDLEDQKEEDGDGLPAQDNGPLLPPTTNSDRFEDLNLSEKTMKAIKEMGFEKMTNIQRSVSWPLGEAW
jgi:ATP-dependent RNA helicase DDX18/HAS1